MSSPSYLDLALEDAAGDVLRMEAERDSALADAITYRWCYLEVVGRLMAAEATLEKLQARLRAANAQIQQLMGVTDGA